MKKYQMLDYALTADAASCDPDSTFYLSSDADARIGELERALRYYRDEYSGYEPSQSVLDRMVDELIGPRDAVATS
jgi:hypothetical protein